MLSHMNTGVSVLIRVKARLALGGDISPWSGRHCREGEDEVNKWAQLL